MLPPMTTEPGMWTARAEVLCVSCARVDAGGATASVPWPSTVGGFARCDRCGARVVVGVSVAALQAAVRGAIRLGCPARLEQAGGMLCVAAIVVNPGVDEVDQAVLRLTDSETQPGAMDAYLYPRADVPGVRLRRVTASQLTVVLRRLTPILFARGT